MLILIFKCLKGIAPMYLSSQFTFMNTIHSKGTRSQTNCSLHEPSWNNNAGRRTFHMRATKIWNSLPANIKCNFDTLSLHQLKYSSFVKPV